MAIGLDSGAQVGGHRAVFNRAATHALCAVAPIAFTAYMVWFSARHHALAYDLDRAFWPAGSRVLHGLTPYPSPTSFAATHGIAFVYPAAGAYLFATFGWMPRDLADVLFTMICIALTVGTLWLLEVRDWRVYGVAFLWGPVVSGWQTANVSLLLAFAVAIAWRYRDRAAVAGSILGLIVSVKLFLWPLAGWLILTRRWKALGVAVTVGVATTLGTWAVLGFGQLGHYLTLVKAVTKVEELTAYTPLALALRLGLDRAAADAVTAALILLVVLASLRSARKGQEASILLGAITISLLATPVVWRHYFVLLLVPLAIARPRLSVAWALPVLLVIVPVTGPPLWQLVFALVLVTVLVTSLFAWPSEPAPGWLGTRPGSSGRRRPAFWPSGRPSHVEISTGSGTP